ncbi:MAG: hypothetical protein G01um101470_312 [Parcubacteria group bacterium Gr01-1014_70]|nr:MAG: hypothetical protein G01um101470_312 [Parcubacteria group bacterium Gr01-1014_70]
MAIGTYFTKDRIAESFRRYERRVSIATFLFGFAMDNFTLTRIDLFFDNLVLLFYLTVAGIGIMVVNLYEERRFRAEVEGITHISPKSFQYVRAVAPFGIQYAFGGLFSGFFVFYSRGASLAASWPFLLVLVFLLVGNEFLRNKYQRLTFQVSIFFFVLYSYMIFALPLLVGHIGPLVFVASGLLSLFFVAVAILLLVHFIPRRIKEAKRMLLASIATIFATVNILYVLNVIPPLPLSMKEAGVYYSVTRVATGYRVVGEEQGWYAFLLPRRTIHVLGGSPLFFYSAVFAPAKLVTTIVHEWQLYDYKKDAWVMELRVSFPITGGRDGGYRGYSERLNVEPGLWRVNVETARGQLLGRRTFTVEETETAPMVRDIIL